MADIIFLIAPGIEKASQNVVIKVTHNMTFLWGGKSSKKKIVSSIDIPKAFDKIQHCSVIGSLMKSLIERFFLAMINSIYGKNTSNNILNGKRLKAFSQRSETRYRCPLLPLRLVIVLEVLEQL